ncbi:MAG TPA: VanZ family protein [Cryomorphaceae bacterium]|nr:VanZ family protein [Cryomorphaceae bacterium]
MKIFLKSFWPALLWVAFILLLIGIPGTDLPDVDVWKIDIEDKLAHIAVFSVLAILSVRGIHKLKPSAVSTADLMLVAIIGIAYGGLTELLQDWIFPSRYASITDFIADAIGMILGTLFANWYFVKQSNQ